MFVSLMTALVVFGASYYLIQISDGGVGSWKYCLIIGFGVAILPFVWRLTSSKTGDPKSST
jgi:hypothetical protein